MTVVSHDVILHPCRGLELFPTVLTGEGLLHAAGKSFIIYINPGLKTLSYREHINKENPHLDTN